MERNSASGMQSQNSYRYSTRCYSMQPLSASHITSHRSSLRTEVSTEKYNHLRERVKHHESQLGTIERRIRACTLKHNNDFELAKVRINSKTRDIQEFCSSLMKKVGDELTSRYEDITIQKKKFLEYRDISNTFLQTHKEDPEDFMINASQALAALKLTDLPRLNTEIIFKIDEDTINSLKSKLDDLLAEIEKCQKNVRISAYPESEDRYVVNIDDQKLSFETKEGYITSFLGETQIHANQTLNHPEGKEDLNLTADMDIEQNINALDQAQDKEDENPCLDIPKDQHESSVSQPPEPMQRYIQEEDKSHDTVSEELSRNISDEDYKSSTIKKPLKSRRSKNSSRNKKRDKDLEKFIEQDTDSDQIDVEDEWSHGPKLKAERSEILEKYKERRLQDRHQEHNTPNKHTKRFRASK